MIDHFFKKGQGGLTAFNDSVKPAGGILSRVISGRTSLPPLEEALIENMESRIKDLVTKLQFLNENSNLRESKLKKLEDENLKKLKQQ
mgnify:CR=1 FL=1